MLKVNSNVRYASDAPSSAAFVLACEQAGVPLQRYAHRSDLPCGSTIGPITAAAMGIPTVDVGAPQLAMHSCPRAVRRRRPGPLRRRHGRLPRARGVTVEVAGARARRSGWARRPPGPRCASPTGPRSRPAHPDRAGGDAGRAAARHRGLRHPRAGPPGGAPRRPPASPRATRRRRRAAAAARRTARRAARGARRRHRPPGGAARRGVRPASLEACHRIGDVTYIDRSCAILETLVQVEGEGVCSLVITLQGRADGTDAFCTLEAIEHVASPPVRQVVERLVARPARSADR